MADMETTDTTLDSAEPTGAPLVPPEPLAPIQSRFLFVDVAALRAKQLRKGARQRFEAERNAPGPHKPERVAMEEVRRGLVYYDVPPQKGAVEA
jgi:DNA-directed RNA polymerase omega subunit